MAFPTDWLYRKSITLSRASGAVTNYQMKLKVGESSGAAGENVDCGGLCKTDFSDLRFTASDGTTLLDYWIESVSGTTPNQLATVWIEFNSIGTGATTFYMYYGNAGASAVSDGDTTFPFFEHFLADPPDAADWYHWLNNGSSSVSGSIFATTGHASYNAWGCKQKFGTNYAYRGRVKVSSEATGGDMNVFGFDDRSDDGTAVGAGADNAKISFSNGSQYYDNNREGTQTRAARTDGITAYTIAEIQRNASTDVRFLINDTLKVTSTTNVPTDTCGFIQWSNSATPTISWDWVLVRQFLVTEPAWGSWGGQEDLSGGGTVMNNQFFVMLLAGGGR